MAQRKKLGKFYPLTPDICETLREGKLTAAQWRIWSYLVQLDPYGDHYVDLETLDVIEKCNVSKTTVWRAFCKFQKMGLFDFQDKGFHFKNETGVSKMKSEISKMKPEISNLKPEISNLKPEISNLKLSTAEIKSGQEFQNPKTNKTNKTIQTLSEGEREKFKNFCERQADDMPERIVLLDSWIEAHFEELFSLYKKVSGHGESSAAVTPSKNSEVSDEQEAIATRIRNEVEEGNIKVERYHSSGGLVNGVRRLTDNAWFNSIEEYLGLN